MLHELTSQWPQRWKQEDTTIANATGLPEAEVQALRCEFKH